MARASAWLGEALALRWKDVDVEGRVLGVRRRLSMVNGRTGEAIPKTRVSDTVVLLSWGRLHDLRYASASLMLAPGLPLALVGIEDDASKSVVDHGGHLRASGPGDGAGGRVGRSARRGVGGE